MKLTVWKPVDIEVDVVTVTIPKRCVRRDDDVPAAFYRRNPDPSAEFYFRIQAGGLVEGWPSGEEGRLQLKVRDEGVYYLIDTDGNEYRSAGYYVPQCIPDGGDYIDLDIGCDGRVNGWEDYFTPKNVLDSFFPVPEDQP